MHDEHTLMDSRTCERFPMAVLSIGRPMLSVTLLIVPTMDVSVTKAEGPSSLLEDAMLWESAGSLLLEGALLWELVGSSFLNFEKNFLTFGKNFLKAFMVVRYGSTLIVSVLIYTTEHKADTLIWILFTRGRAASNMRVHSRRLRRLRYHPLV